MSTKFLIPQNVISQFEIDDLEKICRVVGEEKSLYSILGKNGIVQKIKKKEDDEYFVGDWVVANNHTILKLAVSQNSLSRMKNNRTQVIARNVDQLWILTSANDELNMNRLERYIQMAHVSHVSAAIILTKIDLIDEVGLVKIISELGARFPETLIIPVSINLEINCDLFLKNIIPNETIALMGSSGVGKSTFINFIRKNEDQNTQSIGNNSKGKHTTTSRKMFLLDNGCFMIDNPGIRGVAIDSSLVQRDNVCKFSNCNHTNEQGCFYLMKVEKGEMTQESLKNFKKMERENEYYCSKDNIKKQLEKKSKWKEVTKNARKNRA